MLIVVVSDSYIRKQQRHLPHTDVTQLWARPSHFWEADKRGRGRRAP